MCYREIYNLNAYIKKEEKSQTNKLTFHHKTLEIKEKTNPKTSGGKKIIMARKRIEK